jgi:hypothetical protein
MPALVLKAAGTLIVHRPKHPPTLLKVLDGILGVVSNPTVIIVQERSYNRHSLKVPNAF